MKKSGYRKVLAALLALLLAVPGSWAAFATETDPVYVYDEAAKPVEGGIAVVNNQTALEVNAYGDDASAVVNGDVSLESEYGGNREAALRVSSGEGTTATATVNGSVEATGTGEGTVINGVIIRSEGNSVVYIYGDLVVTAEEMAAIGITSYEQGAAFLLSRGGESESQAEENAGGSGSVTMSGDMVVTSGNDKAVGVENIGIWGSDDLHVDIGGNLKVSGTTGIGIITENQDPDATPEKDFTIGGSVDVTGTAGNAAGIVLEGNQTVTVDIGGNLNVTGNPDPQTTDSSFADLAGVMIMDGDNTVTIGGEVNVTGDGSAVGIGAMIGNNTVNVGGGVIVEGGKQTAGIVMHTGEEETAELSVGGDVNATSAGENADMSIGVLAGGEGTVKVDILGDVNASTEGEQDTANGVVASGSDVTMNIGGGVTASGDHATGAYAEIYGKSSAPEETADAGAGAIEVNITGDVTADGNLNAEGVHADVLGGDLTVNIGGAVSATAGGNDEYGAVKGLELNVTDGTATATVGEGITAEAGSGSAGGVVIDTRGGSTVNVTVENGGVTANGAENYYNAGVDVWNEGAQVQVDVTGNVESNGTGIAAYGDSPSAENPAVTSVHVDGNVTSTGTDSHGIYADVSDETDGTERIENNSQVEILVEGDVTGENTAVWIDADTTVGTVDLTVDGTVSGGEHSIVLSNEANPDQVSITVWEVKPNDAGALVERAEVNRDTGDTVYTQDAEAEKQIQYIIHIAQPEYISTEGTTDQGGYQVAHEGDTVFVKLNIPEGFTLDSVWRDVGQTLNVVRNAKGEYYLAVPRGGGVELSVTLREIVTEPAERPLTITMDPNGGTINGKEGILLIAAYDGRIFTLPAAPEKEGAEFLGWFATPYAKEDSRWAEPAADSKELKQAGQKDKITHNVFYTAIWGEPAAEEAGEAAPAEAGEADVTEPEAAETEAAGSEATEPEAEGGAEG